MSALPFRPAVARPARRRVRCWLTLLAVAPLLGCAPFARTTAPPAPEPRSGPDPVERAWIAPLQPPPGDARTIVAGEPAFPLRQLAAALRQRGGEVREFGEHGLIATISGDPEPYVDCGTFAVPGSDPTTAAARVPAARLQVRVPVLPASRPEVLLRQFRLDARVRITAEPEVEGALVIAVADYAVTRTVDRVTSDGRVLSTERETVAFSSDELGRFSSGLSCVATGRLEAEMLTPLAG